MADPAMIDEPVEAEAVGLALLLSDTHAAIIAAGDEILTLFQVVAHGLGPLPKAAIPLLAEPAVGHFRDESAPSAAAQPIAAAANARGGAVNAAPVASVVPAFDVALAQPTMALEAGLPPVLPLSSAPTVQAWMERSDGDMPPLPLPATPAPAVAAAPIGPTPPVDYTAYAPASHAPSLQQVSVMRNPDGSRKQHPLGASLPPTMAPMLAPAQPVSPASEAAGQAPTGRSPDADTSTAPSPAPMHGDVFLDGVRVGRWLSDTLARAANAPPSGSTAFDPRMGPSWPGAQQGH